MTISGIIHNKSVSLPLKTLFMTGSIIYANAPVINAETIIANAARYIFFLRGDKYARISFIKMNFLSKVMTHKIAAIQSLLQGINEYAQKN